MSNIIETMYCECDFCGREGECYYLNDMWSCVDVDACEEECEQQESQSYEA